MSAARMAFAAWWLLATGGASAQEAGQAATERAALLSIELTGRDANGRDLRAYGTGFLIHPGGYGLTASHLVDELIDRGAVPATVKATARLADFSGSPIDVSIERGGHDLAYLKLSYRNGSYPYARLACNDGFDLGNLMTRSTGFPYICKTFDARSNACLAGAPRFIPGEGRTATVGDGQLPDTMEVGIRFDYGASGSPLYLSNGVVVGVAKGNLASSESMGEFIPISWADALIRGIPGLPACVDMSACVNSALATAATAPFTVSGGARAPGTGFNTSAQYDTADVCFAAPPGSSIAGAVTVVDNGNNGGRGRLSAVRYATDANGAVTGACVTATAWSDATPFGAGGWQNVTLSGTTRGRSPTTEASETARRACASAKRD